MNPIHISKNFKKASALTFILATTSLAFAQQKVTVNSQIVDSQNLGVAYASITFSNAENKLYSDAALSDDKGNVTLSLMPGKYQVSIEAIGFSKGSFSRNIITAGRIDPFKMELENGKAVPRTKDLETVVIQGQTAKPYRVELDKKVYDPSTDLLSKGGNLQDVLSNVPSVEVETDGTVSMRGNSNIKFLINGKPSALLGIDSGADGLKSIPADQIDKIEVITNPSSKFEASGSAGILNIILKKTKGRGFNGSVTGTLGYLPSTNLNTNLSWKKGSWTWFLNGGGGYRESEGKNDSKTRFFDATTLATTSFYEQNSNNKSNSDNYNANAGFTVDLSEKTSFNMSGMIRNYKSISDNTVDNYSFDFNQTPNSYSQTLANSESTNLSLQGDIGLDHKFNDSGHNIYLSGSLQKSDNESFEDSREFDQSFFTYGTRGKNNTTNKTFIGKVDYELPIGETSKFEAGYRFDHNANEYDFLNRESDFFLNYNILDEYSGNTVYKETLNAVYTQFKSKIDKLGYQLGLRMEDTNININYQSLSGNFSDKTKKYTGFFPSVFLSYDLGSNNNQLLLNYSRRINRPRSWFMTPYPTSLANRQNLFRGNEDLNPSYVDSFELGYAIQKKKFTINPTVYYRQTQDDTKFVVLSETPGSNVLITTPYNVGNEKQYGLDINATADLFPWYKIMASADLFGYKSEGEFFDADRMAKPLSFDGSGFSTRLRLTNTFKIDKTLNMQVQGFYRGGQKTASSKSQPMYVLNFGANKTVLDGNGTISFNIQDVLGTRGRKYTSFGNTFDKESFMRWSPRSFSLSFSYRFKQGEKVAPKKRAKDINSNASGGEDEGPM